MPKQIIVTIDLETATARVEAQGYEGGECLEATHLIEEAIGSVEPEGRTMKPEARRDKVNVRSRQHIRH